MHPFRATILGAACLLAAPLCAQGSLMPYLPQDTMLVVSVPDLQTSTTEFSQMPLARMWAEEEVQGFFGDVLKLAKAKFEEGMTKAKEMHAKGELPFDPEVVKKLSLQGGTFAVTRLGLEQGDFGPMPNMGLILHLDFGEATADWMGLIEAGLGMMEQEAGEELAKEESKVGDVRLVSYTHKGPMQTAMGLHLAMVPGGILVGTLKDEVQALVEAMQKRTPVLGATERFKECAGHVQASGAEMQVYARLDPMLDFGMQALGMAQGFAPELAMVDMAGVGRAVEALGLKSIRSIGLASSYEGGKAVWKGYMVAPAPERRGLMTGSNKLLDTTFLKWVPKEAVSFSAGTLDPMSFYDGILGALRAYDEKLSERLLGQLAEEEKKLGFSVREDLFGALGDTVVTWSMPMQGLMAAPEMVILVKVKEQDRIVKVLTNLAAMTDGAVAIEKSDKRGIEVYSLSVNIDASEGMGMNPFDMISPTFSFKDGWMVMAFSPSDVKRAFARMDREDNPEGDIRGNKEFAAYAGSYPKELQSLAFTDWKAQFEGIYQGLTFLMSMIPMGEEVPLDMSQLPEVATLTQHLFGAISYSVVDANGYATTSVGPFGPEVMMVVGALLMAGIGLTSVRHF